MSMITKTSTWGELIIEIGCSEFSSLILLLELLERLGLLGICLECLNVNLKRRFGGILD